MPATTAGDGQLHLHLDLELPPTLPVGAGTVVFLAGACWHERQQISELSLIVDGQPHAAMEFGMPRRDIYESVAAERLALREDLAALRPTQRKAVAGLSIDHKDPSYRSGFWGSVPLSPASAERALEVEIRATLADGSQASAPIQTVVVETHPNGRPAGANGVSKDPLIAICMATFDPDLALFERQIESIRSQTHERWICIVSDDDSRPDTRARIEQILQRDSRFTFWPATTQLGFYRNFERALSMVPDEARYVALADQDDRWHRDKLATLRDSIGDAQLVYSDLRVVDREGEVLGHTFFDRRANNSTDLGSLMMMNTVTGAAAMFRRDLLQRVLPFPPRHGPNSFHDQWIAMVALALGRLAYVDRPLYDYVQHDRAVLGHPSRNRATRPPLRHRVVASFLGLRGLYFGDYCRMVLLGQTLLLRCGPQMPRRKVRAVRRVTGSARAPGVIWLALRSLRGRKPSNPTHGQERNLLRAVFWPKMARAAVHTHLGRRLVDGSLPAGLRSAIGLSAQIPPGLHELRAKIDPLDLEVDGAEPERVNVLVPGVDLGGLFGGYIGIFNLARRLSTPQRPARIVCFEWGAKSLPADWQQMIEGYSGLRGLFDEVEFAFPPDRRRRLRVSPNDRFVATTWWSAHLAEDAGRRLGRDEFLYVIQDYEPLFYPWGTWHALAEQSYGFSHSALFSTEFLRDFFRDRRLGVYGNGRGDSVAAAFRNAITPIEPPSIAELAAGRRRRLLFYTRLEDYSPRNLFELGTLALTDLVADGTIDSSWDLYGIGTVGGATKFRLGRGVDLEILPRQPEDRYADLLRKHDVGLSLMLSPHPSLVPLEMASAGMLVVTNSYANKTPDAMSHISENLITVEPTRAGIARGITTAIREADDLERRARGAHINWNTSWDDALPDELVQRLHGFLDAS
jgi:hypothetical protein